MFNCKFYRLGLTAHLVISLSSAALPIAAFAQDKTIDAAAIETKGANDVVAEGQDSSSTAGDGASGTNSPEPISNPAAVEPSATTTGGANHNKSSFGKVLKTNIIETFELDPRLQKTLTEGDPLLRPIKLEQNYYSMGFNPTIDWDRTNGPPWVTSYNTRAMALYAVGPITKHLSGWFQMLPQSTVNGFFPKWEIFQGQANYGNDKIFFDVRGGQSFGWQNSGFGGADRVITQTSPGVYTPINGFDPTSVTKMVSLEATGLNWTTGKVFGFWQPAAGTSSDPNITFSRGEGVGLVLEKLIGKTGISGIQTNLTMGRTGAVNGNMNALGNPIGFQQSPYIWWTSWINKSFQDKQGYVRLNPSFGLNVFHQRRFLDDPSAPENRSTAYGYTFDLVAIPVRSYWTTILRYDQYRGSNLIHNNTTYTFTVGQAIDFHTPDKGRIRVTLDYQFVGQAGVPPSHRFILGFWPIW
jgi:hypothetical protein